MSRENREHREIKISHSSEEQVSFFQTTGWNGHHTCLLINLTRKELIQLKREIDQHLKPRKKTARRTK